jgi:hypothetical protein
MPTKSELGGCLDRDEKDVFAVNAKALKAGVTMLKNIAIGCTILVSALALIGVGWLIASVIDPSQQSAPIIESPVDFTTTDKPVNTDANASGGNGDPPNVSTAPTVMAIAPPPVNENPWGYNFTTGNLIYYPGPGFCSYFSCTPRFWQYRDGYVVECTDGKFSHSGGTYNACVGDGGVSQILYQPLPTQFLPPPHPDWFAHLKLKLEKAEQALAALHHK